MNIKKFAAICITAVIMLSSVSALTVGASAAEEVYLPSSYGTGRDYMTAPKDQGEFGLCWAFSAVACAEADAIKNHGADRAAIDLSEWHLAYFAYHGERTGTGDKVALSGSLPYSEIGGFDMLSVFTLSAGIGFADEAVAPYDKLVTDPNASINEELMYECDYKIDNIYFYDITTERDRIKSAIMEYGAVSASYFAGDTGTYTSTYYNPTYYSQYCPDAAIDANHAITIVGWNDSFSRYKFNSSVGRPSQGGAWLVKNSWGEDFGDGGYFWISYEDATLVGGTVFDVSPTNERQHLYQHDGGGAMLSVTNTRATAIANVFTASGRDEQLSEVSVCISTDALDVPYTLEVFLNPSLDSGDFGEPIYTQHGALLDGYNTVSISEGIELTAGDVFVVSISSDSEMMVDGDASTSLGNGTTYMTYSSVGYNETFYRGESGRWTDISRQESPWNARIKAHTVELNRETLHIKEELTVYPIEYGQSLKDVRFDYLPDVMDHYGNPVNGYWNFVNLDPDHRPNDGEKVEVIFTPFDTQTYKPLKVKVKIEVNESGKGENGSIVTDKNDLGITVKPDRPIFSDGSSSGSDPFGGIDLEELLPILGIVALVLAVLAIPLTAVGVIVLIIVIKVSRKARRKRLAYDDDTDGETYYDE